MAIRLPLKTIASFTNNDEVGAGSVNGFVNAGTFTIPQDTDNIVVKFTVSGMAGGGVSAQLQTTDDGGTTWYGIQRTSIVSSATGDATQWIIAATTGDGQRSSSVVAVGSIVSGGIIGNSAPSTLGSAQGSGLPILSQLGRVVLQLQSGVSTSSILTEVKVNSQSATA